MKTMKKLLSIAMVLALVLSLGASAFAATVTVEPKEGDPANHQYEVYQIFTGTQNAASGDKLADIKWGDGITDIKGLVDELVKISDFANIAKVGGKADGEPLEATDNAVAENLAAALNASNADAFAAVAEKFVTKSTATVYSKPGEGQSNTATVPNGYYLIIDKSASVDGSAYNKTMLQVTDDVVITAKFDIPSSKKKVGDVNDSEKPVEVNPGPTNDFWEDSADHDIGDLVWFKLTGNIPSLENYDEYEIIFHDTECEGLTFQPGSVKVYVGDQQINTGFEVVEDPDDGCTFEVKFEDVKTIPGVGTGNVTITVVYQSQLNGSAAIGKPGNPNEMEMEYTNKSDNSGHGRTQSDKVIVFTYDLDVNKVDGEGQPLDGADFAVYKYVCDGYVAKTGEKIIYVNPVDGDVKEEPADGYKAAVEVELTVSGDKNNMFYGKGIDDGTYLLVETKTPAGYNSIDPKEFTVTGSHDPVSEDPQLTDVTSTDPFKFDLTRGGGSAADALAQAEIENNEGVELPETGGIGTTIFYVVGAILVAGAVILLVTKKRMNQN